METIPNLLTLPLEIQTKIAENVFEERRMRILHSSERVAVYEPKHNAFLATCRTLYRAFSRLFSARSHAILGDLREVTEATEGDRKTSLASKYNPKSMLGFWDTIGSYWPIMEFLTNDAAAKRFLELQPLEFRNIEQWAVKTIMRNMTPGTRVKELMWTDDACEYLTKEVAIAHGALIPREMILGPEHDSPRVPLNLCDLRRTALNWAFFHNTCGAGLNLRIRIRLLRWVYCASDPHVLHEVQSVSNSHLC